MKNLFHVSHLDPLLEHHVLLLQLDEEFLGDAVLSLDVLQEATNYFVRLFDLLVFCGEEVFEP